MADEIAGDLALDNGEGWRKMVGDGRLLLTTDADQFLPQADVVVTAASTTQKLLTPQNLKRDAIVCDTSQPSNVSETIEQERPDVLVMEGGIIAVPGRPDLGWQFGLEPGCSFACMAETMMLALEKRVQHGSLGLDLDMDFLSYVTQLADKHGFTLA
ncbi:MAG: hypothetical protein GY803_01035 [Chloroflexi bacterium]|nr:hypothetical protein [Chloroflexota bacterium]